MEHNKQHPLYNQFKKVLRIEDSMSVDANPFIIECIRIAEQHAEKYKSKLESFSKWTDDQCSWPDAGVRCRESSKQVLANAEPQNHEQ